MKDGEEGITTFSPDSGCAYIERGLCCVGSRPTRLYGDPLVPRELFLSRDPDLQTRDPDFRSGSFQSRDPELQSRNPEIKKNNSRGTNGPP